MYVNKCMPNDINEIFNFRKSFKVGVKCLHFKLLELWHLPVIFRGVYACDNYYFSKGQNR